MSETERFCTMINLKKPLRSGMRQECPHWEICGQYSQTLDAAVAAFRRFIELTHTDDFRVENSFDSIIEFGKNIDKKWRRYYVTACLFVGYLVPRTPAAKIQRAAASRARSAGIAAKRTVANPALAMQLAAIGISYTDAWMASQSFDEKTLEQKIDRCMLLQLGGSEVQGSRLMITGLSTHCCDTVVEGWNLNPEFALHLAFCSSCQAKLLENPGQALEQLRKDEGNDFSDLPIQIAVTCANFSDWVWEAFNNPDPERIDLIVAQIASSPILTKEISRKDQKKSEEAIWSAIDYMAIKNGLDRDNFPYDTLLVLIFLATCYRFTMAE